MRRSTPIGPAPGYLGERVLAWSGPGGWRNARPRLVAAPAAGGAAPRSPSDDGFSLIELMVVLLVIGILMAIAIPTFLGTTGAADDRSAQSNLATVITDAKSQFQTDGQTYGNTTSLVQELTGAQLDLQFKDGAAGPTIHTGSSTGLADVSVAVSSDGNSVVLAAYSIPGNCFYVVDNSQDLSASVAGPGTPYAGTPVGSGLDSGVRGHRPSVPGRHLVRDRLRGYRPERLQRLHADGLRPDRDPRPVPERRIPPGAGLTIARGSP